MSGVRTNGSTGLTASSRSIAKRRSAPLAAMLPGGAAQQAELTALRREQKEMSDALFEAVQVHRKLCAPREARRGSFEIAGEMFAVRHLSGDFLKVLDLGSRTGLALGDIAGKGLSAGLWVAHLIGLIRIYTTEQAELPAALESINRELCSALPSAEAEPMVALFLARLDAHTGELEYCNAGQPAALLLRRSGAVELLREGGPVLGAVREAAFTCGRVRLEPGDTLVAYSDGVVESRGPVHSATSPLATHHSPRFDSRSPSRAKVEGLSEEFGVQRLSGAVRATNGSSASQALFSTLGTVLDFASGHPLEDDLTLMVVRRRPRTGL